MAVKTGKRMRSAKLDKVVKDRGAGVSFEDLHVVCICSAANSPSRSRSPMTSGLRISRLMYSSVPRWKESS